MFDKAFLNTKAQATEGKKKSVNWTVSKLNICFSKDLRLKGKIVEWEKNICKAHLTIYGTVGQKEEQISQS